MSNDPHTIGLDRLLELVHGLGIEADPEDLKSIRIEGGRVQVVRHRRNEAGQKYLVAENELATETVTIRIEGRV